MKLLETSSQWGNLYRRRYYLNGTRISETRATCILREHYYETVRFERGNDGIWRKEWNIGPYCDAPSLLDHPDLA